MEQTFLLIIANLLAYVPTNVFRPGQRTFYDKIRQAIIDGFRTMYIAGPTGMGKTFLQVTLAKAMISQSDIKILILMPKIGLLKQMMHEFMDFASSLAVGLVGGGWKQHGKQVTLMTYHSFINMNDEQLKQFAAIFLDEAHEALGKKRRAKIDKQTHALIIGFTATPAYSETKNLKEWLGLEVHRILVPEGVQIGLLSGIQFIVSKVKIKIRDKNKGESKSQYEKDLSSQLIREGANIAAAYLYKKLFQPRGLRFIMFTLTVSQGEDLVEELKKWGISARLIEGTMKTGDRETLLKDFKNNKFEVLVGIDIPKTGFNDVGVCGALFAYCIGTIVGLEQGGGRATRIWKKIPSKIGYVVQLMFEGKDQVFYSEILGGKSVILPENLDEKTLAEMKAKVITRPEIEGIFKPKVKGDKRTRKPPEPSGGGQPALDPDEIYEILESIEVDEEDVTRAVKGYQEEYVRQEAPEGWFTASQIKDFDDVQGEYSKIKELAESYRKTNPDWFKVYIPGTQFTEHYAPPLVAILRKLCAKKEKAPEGWFTVSQIANLKGVQGDGIKVKKLAEEYRDINPSWFKEYRAGSIFTEHYAPPLVAILRKLCAKKEKAPEGWFTASQIKDFDDVQGEYSKIKELAESYRKTNPDWFKVYTSENKKSVEHYAPSLVTILRKLCAKKEKAPEGWYTTAKISRFDNIEGGNVKIKEFAESYKDTNPEWFKIYMSGQKPSEHCAPALVAILRKHFTKK
jgi:hypothetical protein